MKRAGDEKNSGRVAFACRDVGRTGRHRACLCSRRLWTEHAPGAGRSVPRRRSEPGLLRASNRPPCRLGEWTQDLPVSIALPASRGARRRFQQSVRSKRPVRRVSSCWEAARYWEPCRNGRLRGFYFTGLFTYVSSWISSTAQGGYTCVIGWRASDEVNANCFTLGGGSVDGFRRGRSGFCARRLRTQPPSGARRRVRLGRSESELVHEDPWPRRRSRAQWEYGLSVNLNRGRAGSSARRTSVALRKLNRTTSERSVFVAGKARRMKGGSSATLQREHA